MTPTHVMDLSGAICMANQAMCQLMKDHAVAFKAANGQLLCRSGRGVFSGYVLQRPCGCRGHAQGVEHGTSIQLQSARGAYLRCDGHPYP